ncbi:MAG: type II toxin-antitoxin system RelE/ParE family toxin [Candidatus Atribacteria bacterium]|nr:type II toxin-antitoxin system RelE/ParE family toxin [Candidatus Atribacteria bacterium]
MFEVTLTQKVQRYYDRLPKTDVRGIDEALKEMEKDPGSGDVAPWEGELGIWRKRVGGYRLLFQGDRTSQMVNVALIRPRGDVYK